MAISGPPTPSPVRMRQILAKKYRSDWIVSIPSPRERATAGDPLPEVAL